VSTFATGSLVSARGREWVVLPGSDGDLLLLRPLGGGEEEATGIYLPLEGDDVRPARFELPDPRRVGDHRSSSLLRDALRLGFRSSAGPFRSFGHIAVEPRPYQLVPLLMALRLDPVRLLIADDVGIGKTIEAALVARELLDAGDARRLAVLCPPHLAEQWQAELAEKFHIAAELVLAGTAARLERGLALGESLFDRHAHVIVSTDFIKSDRRRHDFLRACPELVVVDEAHACVAGGGAARARHQRHELLRGLARDSQRHLILVTATPHSGDEDAFRSLLALLDPGLERLPADLGGPANEPHRRHVARHLVQRRRADIRRYVDTETPFPDRTEAERTYTLTPEYRRLLDRALDHARESVADPAGGAARRRVRWWSALALLRSLASSPAAAAATLRNRSRAADAEDVEEADAIGRRTVLDQIDDEGAEGLDVAPGGDAEPEEDEAARSRRRLREMARAADALRGDGDGKLTAIVPHLAALIRDGYRPIVFCRFIPTADYLAAELRARLPGRVEVAAVTGLLPPAEREQRVLELAESEPRVLVATDCLSEGINLQQHFDAVVHYDLSWNPTRHEQREGRVDRYGQPRPEVRALTYWGRDNQIDGIVLDVLLRKHAAIRNSLGVSVPVPANTEALVEAILEGLVLRGRAGAGSLMAQGDALTLFDDTELRAGRDDLHRDWDRAADREKRSRTMFAQEGVKVEAVLQELREVQAALGRAPDVHRFVTSAARAHGGSASGDGRVHLDLAETPVGLRERLPQRGRRREAFDARFELPVAGDEVYLARTHPVVEALAGFTLDLALDPVGDGPARRAGAIRTRDVPTRTTLLLLRYRFHVVTARRGSEHQALAEEARLLAFRGAPDRAEWLTGDEAEALLSAQPAANLDAAQAAHFVGRAIEGFAHLAPHVEEDARRRAATLLEAHRRVRHGRGAPTRVTAELPADVLGVYVYLPAVAG
jgi:superfamily II DNA or RNA helicase